jgi:hypothetical protein
MNVSQFQAAMAEEQINQLVWIGAVFNPDDLLNLQQWLDREMDTAIRGNPPHITIMYSKNAPGITHMREYTKPVEAKHIGWAVFTDNDLGDPKENGGILVMLLKCKGVQARHDELMKVPGATWDHAGLRPHISVLRWAKPSCLEDVMLPIYPDTIHLAGEDIEVWDA